MITKEQYRFVRVLKAHADRTTYKNIGNRIIIDSANSVYFYGEVDIPKNVEFKNDGMVFIQTKQENIPPIKFSNLGRVEMQCTNIHPDTVFKNGNRVALDLKSTTKTSEEGYMYNDVLRKLKLTFENEGDAHLYGGCVIDSGSKIEFRNFNR